ncbi:MAG: sugar transferase [Bacteroidales bacterium]|nr:sugar transferase [Bacteroidales bacterium]
MSGFQKKLFIRKILYVFIDILIIISAFILFAWIKPGTKRIYIPTYFQPLLLFEFIWINISLLISKYDLHKTKKPGDVVVPILIANITIVAVITTLIYSFGAFKYSRLIVYGTILLSTLFEIILSYLYVSYKKPVIIPDFDELQSSKPKFYPLDKTLIIEKEEDARYIKDREQMRKVIVNETNAEVYDFISKYIDIGNPKNILVSTRTKFNIEKLPSGKFHSITNLHRVNDFGRINKFLETVNKKLEYGGLYINNAETHFLRKQKILRKYPAVINRIVFFFDSIFHRVIPKLPITKKIYFYVTASQNRAISRAETLGRLYSCGFECIEEKFIEDELYFVVRKVKEPAYDLNPTYGPFIRLKRIGKNGKVIGVYKLRTMHAYSEYLQEYIYNKNKLEEGGKFKNDFRVTAVGRIMRKFWLDELPMFLNLLKGDMKLVGVRPISKHYFELYSEELKQKRTKHKPGLIPPFYVDLPKTLDEIMASEMKYLEAYERNPFITEISYFFKAVFNIVFKKARSK